MAAFVLHVPDIDADGKAYVFPLPTAWVRSVLEKTDLRADESAPEGVVKLFAQRTGADILVTGRIDTRIFADCVRCLEDAPVVVQSEVGSLFTPQPVGAKGGKVAGAKGGKVAGGKGGKVAGAKGGKVAKKLADEADGDDDDLTPEELARERFAGDDIVLDELIREQIILEVPMQPLCREDCAGIEIPAHLRPPADFGETTDENENQDEVDSRFASLKSLANKLASNKE